MGYAALAIEAIAAIVQAVKDGETKDAEAQAQLEAKLQSSISIMTGTQSEVEANMAARDAETMARLQQLEAHPAVSADSGLAATVASLRAQLAARFAAPLPSGQLVDTTKQGE